MTDRNIFMETLHEVEEIVRTSAEAMSRDEILFYFKDMDLTKEQENMVADMELLMKLVIISLLEVLENGVGMHSNVEF